MRTLRWFVILAAAFASAQSFADEALVWKLAKGDQLRYRVVNVMGMTSSMGGREEEMTLNQAMDMDWNVADTLAGDTAMVNQVIRRIVVRLSPNGVDMFEFDSDSQESSENRIVQSIGNVFRRIVDQTFVVKMESSGKITDVTIPNGLRDALRSATAGSAGALDDTSLRQMMSQSAVELPAGVVAKGHKWTTRQTIKLQFATLEMEPQMTYTGLNEEGNAVIRYIPTLKLKANPGASVQLTLSSAGGEGKIVFDPERGRMVKMELSLNMTMEATANGQINTQKIRHRTEVSLEEDSDR